MTVPYQYIVAGLPDIIFDETKAIISLNAYIQEFADQISQKDQALLHCVGFPIDNKNLLSILLQKQETLRQFGNFTEEQLREELDHPDLLPEYLLEFLVAYKEGVELIPNFSWENQLQWVFYEAMDSVENQFLRNWFTFELNLRNILTALNCREEKLPFESHIIGNNEVTELIFKSSAPDFKLPSKVPWAEDLLAIDFSTIAPSEEKLARFRLQQLEDMSEPGLFNVNTVLRIGIALSIVERWQLLDEKTGKEMLDKIINDLESSYQDE